MMDRAEEQARYCENSLMQYEEKKNLRGPSTSRSRVSGQEKTWRRCAQEDRDKQLA